MDIKNIFKSFLFIWLFFAFISNIFAFDANLQLDKKQTDINDYIKLRLEISSQEWWEIWVTDIAWLENFEIISQSQSQSSETSMVIVDWKTQKKISTTHNLDLVLKAKTKWDFEIWPATLKKDDQEIKTNTVDIKVSWENLFVNNNHLNINTSSWNSNTNQNNIKKVQDKSIEKFDDVKKEEFNNKKEIFVFILILFLVWTWFYLTLINKTKTLKNTEKKEEEQEIDFDKVQKEIIYPEVNEDDFINKITIVFKQKLQEKYKIQKVENKTFDEILSEIKEDKDKIQNIVSIINKAKYSDIIWDNSKILNLIKEI